MECTLKNITKLTKHIIWSASLKKFALYYAYIAQFQYSHLNSNITKKFKKWQTNPKYYHNWTWPTLCGVLLIEKILNTNHNLQIITRTNVTAIFQTLWVFSKETPVCKQRLSKKWKIQPNFYHRLNVWFHEIMTNFIIFRLRLDFIQFINDCTKRL